MKIESGGLRWGTAGNARHLSRFDRWLTSTFDDPRTIVGDPANAAQQAAAFRRWAADPANRAAGPGGRRTATPLRGVNDDLRAIAEVFAFTAENPREVREVLGPASPWTHATATHVASWARQVSRLPEPPALNDRNYVDDHAMHQILAALPLLALPRNQHMTITRGDGTHTLARGFGDPQAMRMILLHILTGRRASEIRTCAFDCLSAVSGPGGATTGDGLPDVTRFHYAQSKIDGAPDTILVNREVVAVIHEQQQWVREQLPGATPTFLFIRRYRDLAGSRPPSANTYKQRLASLSALARFTDSTGRPVSLSHTHRFRHTRLTQLAELGLPAKVLQRYAGHATPTMSLHYVAHREEHAEQAFLATVKRRADGSRIEFSHEDHDSLHLFDRADRFLPNGWCTLPPLQRCDKGNACLTCSVFVTDATHRPALERQLAETTTLITRTNETFQQRHGRPMPTDNVWLAQRHAEQAALTQLIDAMRGHPDRPVQGAGCATTRRPTGPVPLELDLPPARKTDQ